MTTRTVSLGLAAIVVALAGCSRSEPTPGASPRATASPRPVAAAAGAGDRYADDTSVPCAIGTAPLTTRCGVEQASTPAGEVLTLRRPEGGFRRLLIARDGRGVVAADGAEPARVTIVARDPGAGRIEVAVGDERYRLPATVRP